MPSPPKKTVKTAEKRTAKQFRDRVFALQSDKELEKIQRYFKSGKGEYAEGDKFIGVRMGDLFALAKEFVSLDVQEIEKLIKDPVHEVRAGAMSILDKKGRNNKLTDNERKTLYDLYLTNHKHINNWDLVDLAAQYTIGRYLYDKPRKPLYRLAQSKSLWERRTAIVSTSYFIRHGETADTFAIAELLVKDKDDLIHKAAGGWIREAGKRDRALLLRFLDKWAATMPRTMLRYAIEHLDPKLKSKYMKMGKE